MAVGMFAASCLAVISDSRSVGVARMKGNVALETPPLDLSGSCVCTQLDPKLERLSTATSNNVVDVWELKDDAWVSLVRFKAKKRITHMRFSWDGTVLYVSDKTGAVFRAEIPDPKITPVDQLPSEAHEQILGHLTSVSSLTVGPEGSSVLISSDRDGKIRVSNVPNYHSIQQYCLDHNSGVSHVELIGENRIVSAASDGSLKVWEFTTGKCLSSRDISEDLKLNWEIRGVTAMTTSYPDSRFIAVIPDGGNGVVLYEVSEEDGSMTLCCSVSLPSMHAAIGVCFLPNMPVMAMLVLPVNPAVEKILGEEHTQYVAAPGVNFFTLERCLLRAVPLEEVSQSSCCSALRMLADSLPTSPLSPDALPSNISLVRKRRAGGSSSGAAPADGEAAPSAEAAPPPPSSHVEQQECGEKRAKLAEGAVAASAQP